MAVLSSGNDSCDLPNKRTADLADQPDACVPANGKNGHCCGANGICNHEVLRDGEPTSDSESVNKKIVKKVVFQLTPSLSCDLVGCF